MGKFRELSGSMPAYTGETGFSQKAKKLSPNIESKYSSELRENGVVPGAEVRLLIDNEWHTVIKVEGAKVFTRNNRTKKTADVGVRGIQEVRPPASEEKSA